MDEGVVVEASLTGCVGAEPFSRAASALGVPGPEAVGAALFDFATAAQGADSLVILAWRPAPLRRSARPSSQPQSPIRGP